LSAASKAHLPPALVKAGAATGRVPACGDIKMVSKWNDCRSI
jgi:hypothetical protein